MNATLRNILAVICGWFIGSIVNMGFVQTGYAVYPLEGVDPNDMEALAAVMPTLSPKYFIFPFLAHALGTLVGAFVAARVAGTKKMRCAFIVGALFLLGGIAVNYMIPGPKWFTVLDLVVAYIPLAWLGGKLGSRK